MTADQVDMVVTRHRGAAEWVASQWGGLLSDDGSEILLPADGIPVYAEADEQLVAGRTVVGNLPLWLASKCRAVGAIEFDGAPPRGAEYTAADMDKAGARIRWYTVEMFEESDDDDGGE